MKEQQRVDAKAAAAMIRTPRVTMGTLSRGNASRRGCVVCAVVYSLSTQCPTAAGGGSLNQSQLSVWLRVTACEQYELRSSDFTTQRESGVTRE